MLPADNSFLACNQASKQSFVFFFLIRSWLPPLTLSKKLNFIKLSARALSASYRQPLLTWLSKTKLIFHPLGHSTQPASPPPPGAWFRVQPFLPCCREGKLCCSTAVYKNISVSVCNVSAFLWVLLVPRWVKFKERNGKRWK